MNPSLSVIMPVHNVQGTVADTVETLLEVVPELTSLFELVLVDDGSTDATRDAAQELSLNYPQVQVALQAQRLGPQASFRGALRYTHGEMLLYCTDRPEFDLHDIPKLWDRRTDGGAVWGRCAGRGALGAVPPAFAANEPIVGEALPDLLLVPRRLLAAWPTRGARCDLLGYLRDRRYSLEAVELRHRRTFGGWAQVVAVPMSRKPTRSAQPPMPHIRPAHDPVRPPLARPNLLQQMRRAFAHDR